MTKAHDFASLELMRSQRASDCRSVDVYDSAGNWAATTRRLPRGSGSWTLSVKLTLEEEERFATGGGVSVVSLLARGVRIENPDAAGMLPIV